jgi:hypothetical protein
MSTGEVVVWSYKRCILLQIHLLPMLAGLTRSVYYVYDSMIANVSPGTFVHVAVDIGHVCEHGYLHARMQSAR